MQVNIKRVEPMNPHPGDEARLQVDLLAEDDKGSGDVIMVVLTILALSMFGWVFALFAAAFTGINTILGPLFAARKSGSDLLG